ncbi:phage baseplate protein, partial [Pasteurella multocida]
MFNFTQISNRRIGKITLDVVTTEEHTSELSITDNPIESGAEIADHAVVKPKQVTIVGVVVDHDHDGAGLNIPGVGNIRGVSDFLNGLPLPAKVISQTQQTIAKATRVASQVQGAIDTAKQAVNKVRSIAPFLPDFGLGGLLDNSDA